MEVEIISVNKEYKPTVRAQLVARGSALWEESENGPVLIWRPRAHAGLDLGRVPSATGHLRDLWRRPQHQAGHNPRDA